MMVHLRSTLIPLAAALALAASATPSDAQVRLIPQVGLYAPVSDLSQDLEGAREIGRQESTLALGLALDTRADAGLGFRLGGMYGSASDVPIRDVGCTVCDARSTVFALTAAAVIRPLPGLPVFRPYGLAGVGGKWYNFDIPDGADELEDILEDETRLAFQLGVGVELDLGVAGLTVELSDYISSYEVPVFGGGEKRQHDMVFSVGLILGGR